MENSKFGSGDEVMDSVAEFVEKRADAVVG